MSNFSQACAGLGAFRTLISPVFELGWLMWTLTSVITSSARMVRYISCCAFSADVKQFLLMSMNPLAKRILNDINICISEHVQSIQ